MSLRHPVLMAVLGVVNLLCVSIGVSAAAPNDERAAVQELIAFPPVETHLLRSKHVPQTYKIQVALPPRKKSDDAPLPVVYLTDGNIVFNMFKEIAALMQLLDPDPPRFILVGIGYPSDAQFAGLRLRARDFTFPRYPNTVLANSPPWEGILPPEKGSKEFYGADDFQRFIAEELIPFIEERYKTLPGDRTYFGHSGGGGFGLYTLFTNSNLFRNYIISSPGLSFHGEMDTPEGKVRYDNYDFALDEARQFIATGKPLHGIKMYMSMGTEEETELAPLRMTSSFYRMAALMKNASIPGLELMFEAFPGETHQTVWPMAFIHGVQAVFGKRRLPSVY